MDNKKTLNYVREFVNGVINYAKDNYNEPPSPLFADAYHKKTKAHLRQDYGKKLECADVVYSNLARQMNFMRVLNALYVLFGESRYQEITEDNFKYYFENYQHENGLFEWGGHRMVDLKTLKTTGEMTHELKSDYPAYGIMSGINKEKTLKYIEAFWNAHVFNWETLETSRHGDYKKTIGKLWDSEFKDPEPFIEVIGLSFINTGSDLIYSALEYYKMTGNEKALLWAKRLENMYYKARHKATGLGVYQFNQPRTRNFTDDFSKTTSDYGDRAKRQFGPELGKDALEGNMLLGGKTKIIYGYAALISLYEAETAKDNSLSVFAGHCGEGLETFAKYGYIPETNMFRPLLADGRDLTGFVLQRDGYYGGAGKVLKQYKATGLYLLPFVKAALMTGNESLWTTASSIASGLGFGNIGQINGKNAALDLNARSTCPYCLFTFLNLYKYTKNNLYLEMAGIIAANIADQSNDFGMELDIETEIEAKGKNAKLEKNLEYISINNLSPLAVICYEAAKLGRLSEIDSSIYL